MLMPTGWKASSDERNPYDFKIIPIDSKIKGISFFFSADTRTVMWGTTRLIGINTGRTPIYGIRPAVVFTLFFAKRRGIARKEKACVAVDTMRYRLLPAPSLVLFDG